MYEKYLSVLNLYVPLLRRITTQHISVLRVRNFRPFNDVSLSELLSYSMEQSSS
jgi:pyruvate/2-oxoacid:ferredoxin oxidoreductase alpha subunit